jgi:catechol 2,3-dioxygenase-like lactoylglutathione lyase family enzyme
MTNENNTGLPGLLGTEHIGFTVPDIEEATRFFVDVIGCEHVYSLGPFGDRGHWMARQLNVHPQAIMLELRFFRCRNGPNFEIFQYSAPRQNREQPANSDIGGHHLGFYVENIHAAIAHLKRHKIRLLGDPVIRTDGPSAGQTWIYFLSPWGMQLELVSFPTGKGYERHTTARLWHPGASAA